METKFKDVAHFKKAMRTAIADYMGSEGCRCCQNVDAHKEHTDALGKMLGVKKYADNSGYDFAKYRTKPYRKL